MTDTDPENEIDDVKSPAHRLVDAPETETFVECHPDTKHSDRKKRERNAENDPPYAGGELIQRSSDDRVDIGSAG